MQSDHKRVFVAATRQNDGKTMVSMGLFHAFQKRYGSVGYMKPVGQQYKVIDGKKIDKDAVLFHQVYGLHDSMAWMSPIAVPKGFTENYILNPDRDRLVTKLQQAYTNISDKNDFVLIEGTGHAGVGSVFDMSNADVANLLGAKVIIVSLGGIGKAIDEILLNKASFDQRGVEVVGVVINKVQPDKYERVTEITRKGLARHGIKVLGCIPYEPFLTRPTVGDLCDELDATMMSGEEGRGRHVGHFVIGDILPHEALDHFSGDTLLICPANREGLIMTALCGSLVEGASQEVSTIVFTGGIQPHPKIMTLLQAAKMPVMMVSEDSFSVATKINRMLNKLHADETEKIEKIQHLIESYVDVDGLCREL